MTGARETGATYLRLRWSSHRSDWFIIPGDGIIQSGAKPFRADWRALITHSGFQEVADLHDWPPPPDDFVRQVKCAVRDAQYGDVRLDSKYWAGDFASVIMMMLDGVIPLCECFYRIEKMRRNSA